MIANNRTQSLPKSETVTVRRNKTIFTSGSNGKSGKKGREKFRTGKWNEVQVPASGNIPVCIFREDDAKLQLHHFLQCKSQTD